MPLILAIPPGITTPKPDKSHCCYQERPVPRKTVWTEGQDTQIRRLRTEGASWDIIALALGLARWTVTERGRLIGVEHPPNAAAVLDESDRASLPAGHSDSWGAITRGTVLEGASFQIPHTRR
jgi:hypothetical protein